jgi:hypothetical protein
MELNADNILSRAIVKLNDYWKSIWQLKIAFFSAIFKQGRLFNK